MPIGRSVVMVDVRLKISAEGVHAVRRIHDSYTDGASKVGVDEKIELPTEVTTWLESLLTDAKASDISDKA